LLVTDSLALPRREPELLRYEHTYVALLKDAFPNIDFIHFGRGGATIRDLFQHSSNYHGTLDPDLVFMQTGIVDCAPRALKAVEQQVISRLPLIGRALGSLIRRNAPRLRRWRRITYTPLASFRAYVEKFEAQFREVHWLGIVPAVPEYESAVQGISRNITLYNAVLRERRFIEVGEITKSALMADHHHLNAEGHRLIFGWLSRLIAARLDSTQGAAAPG
jgi:lysophospholipase L1-like esterase